MWSVFIVIIWLGHVLNAAPTINSYILVWVSGAACSMISTLQSVSAASCRAQNLHGKNPKVCIQVHHPHPPNPHLPQGPSSVDRREVLCIRGWNAGAYIHHAARARSSCTWHYITLNCIAYDIALQFSTLHSIRCGALHSTTLHHITWHFTTRQDHAVHYVALFDITNTKR